MDCKQGTSIIIGQMIDLLEKINPEKYRTPLSLFNGSSIGQHFRHVLEFYTCLCNGQQDGKIDYASRERDILAENNPSYTAEVFKKVLQKVSLLREAQSAVVVADFSTDQDVQRPLVQTTIGRELMYTYDHAIHHLAMIKMGLKLICPEMEINKNIGVAPSTVKHWATASSTTSHT